MKGLCLEILPFFQFHKCLHIYERYTSFITQTSIKICFMNIRQCIRGLLVRVGNFKIEECDFNPSTGQPLLAAKAMHLQPVK